LAWTLNVSPLIDLGGYYAKGLVALNGSVFSPPNPGGGGGPLDTVTSTAPPSFLTLPFGSASAPPAAPGTVLVTDSVTAGDLVRSSVAAFPASPASAALVTFPSASQTDEQLKDAVAEWVAREGGSLRPTMVPYEIRLAAGILSAGTAIPLVVSAAPPTVELGDGTVTLTLAVSVVVRTVYFWVRTYDLTLKLIYAPAPSHDPASPSRVLNIGYTGRTLSGAFWASPLGPLLSLLITEMLESMLNERIVWQGRLLMSEAGFRPTPTAVFSARNVTVTSKGLRLQVVIADLLGPAMVPIPPVLGVAIAPAPKAGIQRTYTVTVTNSATGLPVPAATVTLDNFDAAGASRRSTATTDGAGHAVLNATLRVKTATTRTVVTDVEGVLREVDGDSQITKPLLTVSAAGFNSVMLTLL
jgi:hypothetical protein